MYENTKQGLYSIRDEKAGFFMKPFTSTNNLTAIRELEAAMRQPDNILRQTAEDYTLFKLGEFDAETGIILQEPETRQSIVSAAQVLRALGEKEDPAQLLQTELGRA